MTVNLAKDLDEDDVFDTLMQEIEDNFESIDQFNLLEVLFKLIDTDGRDTCYLELFIRKSFCCVVSFFDAVHFMKVCKELIEVLHDQVNTE